MKHQMSAEQSDSLSYTMLGLITGIMQYLKSAPLNMHLLSIEWVVNGFHAVVVGAFCGGAGWIGKKVAEVGYNSIVTYFKNRKSKKDEKQG